MQELTHLRIFAIELAAHWPCISSGNRLNYTTKIVVIRFQISNCACLGHLGQSAAESRDLVTIHGLVSNTRFLHFRPLRGRPVEMTKVHNLIVFGIRASGGMLKVV